MADDVHLDIGIAHLLSGQRRAYPAEHGPDARHQLARGEGLGHIIVRPGFESADAVGFLAARGEHDDRHIGRFRPAPQATADRSEEHTSELQSLMRISYAVFCLKKKNKHAEKSRQQIINKTHYVKLRNT